MRERVEDLGRIAEKLDSFVSHEVFRVADSYNKHKDDPYEEFKLYLRDDEAIHGLMYDLRQMRETLLEIYDIARWGDPKDG